ncbi:hypothetical protein EZE20_17205 [Arundinibacter roseus]|uniref:Uncharacterized protein n=1 Tax=Arundinibacter roseus TaxID=2070510 RepID=A0A4R4K7D8_9BACT|nr:hypothetical protein EZE20_17205 [Arundinibacter roseus]
MTVPGNHSFVYANIIFHHLFQYDASSGTYRLHHGRTRC